MARALNHFITDKDTDFNKKQENKSINLDESSSDSDLDEICITNVDILFGETDTNAIIVDSEFFKSGTSDQKTRKRHKTTSTSSNDSDTFHTRIPPRNQIIGATPEYMELLKSQQSKIKELTPEFKIGNVLHPQNVYWEYPRAVKHYSSFEGKMGTINHNNGIKKLICKEGQGEKLKIGDFVLINYFVYLEGQVHCVQSNLRENKPYSIELRRTKDHLPVLSYGTLSMKPKEVAAFLTTCEYGYGKLGNGAWVPENTRVLCLIEVLNKLPSPAESSSIINMVPAERKLMRFEDLLNFALEQKAEGNKNFEKGKLARATKRYFEAARCLQDAVPRDDQQEKEKLRLLHLINSNVCLTNLKNQQYKIVIQFAQKSIELSIPETEKAQSYLWCAKAMYYERKLEEAKPFLDRADQLLVNNLEVAELKHKISVMLTNLAIQNESKVEKPRRTSLYNRILRRLSH
ncbi:unnamed protein product [Orchesella dallaii]|uniref:peptidylprolyl isomerase n=1 Tax=Orchesella dallaii TaxID=48710 RepID=A0ABP1PNN2_9HEXA